MNSLLQTAKAIWLVRPALFRRNEQTLESNAFQLQDSSSDLKINDLAQNEFNSFCKNLEDASIRYVLSESTNKDTPDSIFPNNWISFHHDGSVIIYPMMAENRRAERDMQLLENIKSDFEIKDVHDISSFENANMFLEGTGSVVFDHVNRIGYASISQRTNKTLFEFLMQKMGYESNSFNSFDKNGFPIYHTNVMLSIGETYVVVCSESVSNNSERENLILKLKASGREIIDISFEQLHLFAGNMLQVRNLNDELITVLSTTAFDSLLDAQMSKLLDHTRLLRMKIPEIEKVGGGSVRCMMAEIFLPENNK